MSDHAASMPSSSMPSSTTSQPFAPAHRVQGFGATVFAEFTALANEHQAVNLGQGFPNFAAPDFIKEAAQGAINDDLNQYARGAGHPRLVNALAEIYSPLFDRPLDALHEIVVTVGATEGIFATIQALVNPGDEVILIEPFYDSYPAAVVMAGGTPVYVPLRAADGAATSAEWRLDMEELAAAFGPRTRLLILNTPQNPVGKVFSYDELNAIAQLVKAHDALVLSDEVYEWMIYPSPTHTVDHVRIATLPGMWERTVTLGSAGKTFSVTGWKIGWAVAAPHLAHAVLMAHQWIPFAVATPFQEAIAIGLEEAERRGYFSWLGTMYQAKRDKLIAALKEVKLAPVQPDGSYFVLFDTSRLDVPVPGGMQRDVAVCRWLTQEVGVAAIPPSPFYSEPHRALTDNLGRFCFCKTDHMLDEAITRLKHTLT
jgi:N-succinyldiaminopimelate aminotransferase